MGQEVSTGRHSFVFAAAFHLGVALAACRTRRSTNWTAMRKELQERFRGLPDRFEVGRPEFDPETRFPLGLPVVLRHLNFCRSFDVDRVLLESAGKDCRDHYHFDNTIWICPSGVVLLIGEITWTGDALCQLDDLHRAIDEHYPDLSTIFLEIFQVVFPLFPPEVVRTFFCSARIIKLCQKASLQPAQIEPGSPQARRRIQLLEDILIDVYYIDYHESAPEPRRSVGYVSATIGGSEREFVYLTLIAYSSFVGLLWLQAHLHEKAEGLGEGLKGNGLLTMQRPRDLKLFRIFCMRLIGESHPISIRLDRRFVEFLEAYWTECRMPTLEEQIYQDLATLDEMLLWQAEGAKERKNLRIGLSAVFLALVSLTAVVAQLISTLDVAGQLGFWERMLLIYLGLVLGIVVTLVIYLLPGPGRR